MADPSYVGVGTASTTDGGSAPTPALPASLAENDMLMAVFYSRNTTTGVVAISAGWSELINTRSAGGCLAVWMRPYTSMVVAPTFTLTGFTGGAAGDDCLAQVAAWRNCTTMIPHAIAGTVSTNGAATNIGPITGLTCPARDVVVVIGGKLDDYTSVATLSGDGLTWAEIAEVTSVAGADAGMIWDYALNVTAPTDISAKTFSVTGGTAVAGLGAILTIKNREDDTWFFRRRKG